MTAPNVMAYIPPVPTEGQYRLGSGLSAASSDIWINTTHADGTRIACREPDGWEGVEFITPIDTAGGRDGGLIGPPSVAPRTLFIEGAAVSPDPRTLRKLIARLREMVGPRKSVVWEQHDLNFGRRFGFVCYGQGDFRANPIPGNGGVAVPFAFTLVAANPAWKLSTGTPEERCTGLPASDIGGRTYDKQYDWDYGGATNPGGRITANNAGGIPAWPVFSITGPVDTPTVTNETTDRAFVVNQAIPEGVTITIDGRTGLVQPSGYRLVGRPWSLAPGSNTIRWRDVFGAFNEGAQLCVTWRHTSM